MKIHTLIKPKRAKSSDTCERGKLLIENQNFVLKLEIYSKKELFLVDGEKPKASDIL